MCKGGRFARRPTTEYSRSPVLSFFKKSWAHFLCPETFLRCWHFCSVLRGRKQPRGNFCKSTKTHLAKCFISWKEIILKFFCQRLNFTPPKFQIGERFFQTVDFSLVNVLTSREKNFQRIFCITVDFCPLKFRISESTWYRANAVHRNLTFPNPVFCRKNVRCSVKGYQVFHKSYPLSSRGVLQKSRSEDSESSQSKILPRCQISPTAQFRLCGDLVGECLPQTLLDD